MNTKQWMKTGMLALLIGSWSLPSPALAAVEKTETLAGNCSGGCVDTWQVECKDTKTHDIKARVINNGGGVVGFEVTTIGYIGGDTLVGQADAERSLLNFVSYSPGAFLFQPGTKKGPTNALVLVNLSWFDSGPFDYKVEFSCHDLNGGELKNPTATLLQNK